MADRNIGVTSGEYKNIPLKIAAAGGQGKLFAVRSVINHGLVDIMVTDERTAEFCLGTGS
jgi:DNA-binding transcriptional regulator LsrR (DeoR family)